MPDGTDGVKKVAEMTAAMVEKLEAQGAVRCPHCGIEWNRLTDIGVCSDCEWDRRKEKERIALMKQKSKPTSDALDVAGIEE